MCTDVGAVRPARGIFSRAGIHLSPRFRRSLGFAGGLAGVALALLFGTGCDQVDSSSGALSAPETESAERMSVPALKLDDLPADLNLSDTQSEQMEEAIGRLQAARQERWEKRREFRDRRRQDGDRSGPFREGRGSRRPRMDRMEAGLPLMDFLEETSKILDADQFATFAHFLAQRRMRFRPERQHMFEGMAAHFGPRAARWLDLDSEKHDALKAILKTHGDEARAIRDQLEAGSLTPEAARDRLRAVRTDLETELQGILTSEQLKKVQDKKQERVGQRIERRLENLEDQLRRRAEFLGRVLDLTDSQTSEVLQIFQGSLSPRQGILAEMQNGSLAPEDAAYQVWQLEKELVGRIAPLLTPEQVKRFESLQELLPSGLRLGSIH